jgi:hypothetical protein
MASVQLKLGDMFDGPSDLTVLPCSTSGTITSFVRERLIHHRIPYPKPGMRLGDLVVLPFEGGENIAQFVGYAASVAGLSSGLEEIERIGEQLGMATQERSTIRRVSAPLLGAGAGRLRSDLVVEVLVKGFKKEAHPDGQLVLHVLDRDNFDRLLSRPIKTSELLRGSQNNFTAMRVFISYCHTSPEHEKWVESLGTFLRESGIDARLDIWHLRRGMDLPQFMTNELTLAERVVLVSDERYADKADGRVGGVGWETMVIQGDMAKLPPGSTNYLVIVHSKDIDAGLPQYLKTKFVIHWSEHVEDARNRDLLLRELYNIERVPEIGPRPFYL